MERCTPNSYVTPLNQRFWVGSKRRASQYQIDDHASSSGGAANFNHVKKRRAGTSRKLNVVLLSWRVREHSNGQNAQDRQLQRKLSNVRSARAGKATAMENCLNVLRYYLRSAADQYLFTYSHSDPQYLYYKHVYPSHGQG